MKEQWVGIDLAGSERRPTGFCLLEGNQAKVSVLYTDEQILREIGSRVKAVAIDAPLSLPKGRCCLEDDCACVAKAHFRVFETYPGAAQDIWGIPRQKNPKGLQEGLKRFEIKGNWLESQVTAHELDALTCAIVARDYIKGKAMAIGDPEEGLMILPKKTIAL